MARAARKKIEDDDSGEGGGISGEYQRPDLKRAIRIYREEIAPKNEHISTIKGDLSEPHKRIKDECNVPRKVLDFLFQLDGMEDAKRDHWLLALNLGLAELKMGLPRDLVTIARGEDGGAVIPIGRQAAPMLATLSDGEETDLGDVGDEVADEDREDADTGTLAAAIRAMNEADGD